MSDQVETRTDQAAASDAHARSAVPNRKMAAVDRQRPLQLLRGTRKPRKSGGVPRPGAGAMVAYSPSPEPETPDLVDANSCLGPALASSTEHASSLSGCMLCHHSSEIRTGCAVRWSFVPLVEGFRFGGIQPSPSKPPTIALLLRLYSPMYFPNKLLRVSSH